MKNAQFGEERVCLTDRKDTHKKAAVIVKEIGTMKEKPNVFALEEHERCPEAKTHPLKALYLVIMQINLKGKNFS